MQFSKLITAVAAFAVAQVAQAVIFTDPSFNSITAGKAFNITWSEASGPVAITLKNGPSTALVTVSTIATGLSGTSYAWNVPATLTADTYALQIQDSAGVNYSPQFQLIGGVTSASASMSSTSGSSSTGSSTATVTSTVSGNSTTTSTTSGSKSSSTSASKTSSGSSSSTGSKTTSATGASSSTAAPGSAAGLSSPLGFVFLAFAAFLTLN